MVCHDKAQAKVKPIITLPDPPHRKAYNAVTISRRLTDLKVEQSLNSLKIISFAFLSLSLAKLPKHTHSWYATLSYSPLYIKLHRSHTSAIALLMRLMTATACRASSLLGRPPLRTEGGSSYILCLGGKWTSILEGGSSYIVFGRASEQERAHRDET
jgi:hypothetical protein